MEFAHIIVHKIKMYVHVLRGSPFKHSRCHDLLLYDATEGIVVLFMSSLRACAYRIMRLEHGILTVRMYEDE